MVIDEMKHFFIVSNLLNALGADVPLNKPELIPDFPMKPDVIFQTNNPEINSFISIRPCDYIQLKKFMMIEYPTETFEL